MSEPLTGELLDPFLVDDPDGTGPTDISTTLPDEGPEDGSGLFPLGSADRPEEVVVSPAPDPHSTSAQGMDAETGPTDDDTRPELAAPALPALAEAERALDAETSPRARARLLRDVARLYEQAGDAAAAARASAELFELDPSDPEAFRCHAAHLRRLQRWDALLPVYLTRVELTTSPGERVELLGEVARLMEGPLNDPAQAFETWLLAWTFDVSDDTAADSVERLARRQRRWSEVARAIPQAFAEHSRDPAHDDARVRAAAWYAKAERHADALSLLDEVLTSRRSYRPALVERAAVLREQASWRDLVETLARLAQSTSDEADRAATWIEAAEVCRRELGEAKRAVERYLRALEAKPDRVDVMEALVQLYRGPLATEPRDPTDRRAFELLKAHHLGRGEHELAVRALTELLAVTRVGRDRVALHEEIAQLLTVRLGDPGGALDHYEKILEIDPEHLRGLREVSRAHHVAGRHDEALPLLRRLAGRTSGLGSDASLEVHRMYADSARQAGGDEDVLHAYGLLHAAAPSEMLPLWELLVASARCGRHGDVLRLGRLLCLHHVDALGAARVAELHERMGRSAAELGDVQGAVQLLEHARGIDPQRADVLELLADVYERLGDWERAATLIGERARALHANGGQRVRLLEAAGDMWKDRAGGLPEARALYREALALCPDDRRVLHKLLAVYQETGEWSRAVETLDRVAELESRPEVKARYLYTAGVASRDEMEDMGAALERFESALDADPTFLKAFAAIDRMLTSARRWRELCRSYRGMLRRIIGTGKADLEFDLWHNLGLLYRDRRGDPRSAAEAFRAASRLRPDDRTEHRILAELYARLPETAHEYHSELHARRDQEPTATSSYHALFELYACAGASERAWNVAVALDVMGAAEDHERTYIGEHRQAAGAVPRLRAEEWDGVVRHPDLDPRVDRLFAAVVGAVHGIRTRPDPELGLDPAHAVDPTSSHLRVARMYGYATRVLRLPVAPRLFVMPEASGGLAYVGAGRPPASVCGSTLLKGFEPDALSFLVGRHLAYFRGGAFLRTIVSSPAEVLLVFRAARRIAGLDSADASVDEAARLLLSRLDSKRLSIVRETVAQLKGDDPEKTVIRWLRAVELTACRAGLLLCGDLRVAARVLPILPPDGPVDVPAHAKIRDLTHFSASEPYLALRERR